MIDFGFNINRSSQIDLDKVDTSLYSRLCALEPGARTCMNCGSCTASCTAGAFRPMSVRKLLLDLQRGVDARPLLSNCFLCGKCTMVCPRGINTRNLILSICRIYD